jgi:hypothetical protein
MDSFKEGSVVILATTIQIGTIIHLDKDVWVLLACGDIWIGPQRDIRFPQDRADLDACILTVDKFKNR